MSKCQYCYNEHNNNIAEAIRGDAARAFWERCALALIQDPHVTKSDTVLKWADVLLEEWRKRFDQEPEEPKKNGPYR